MVTEEDQELRASWALYDIATDDYFLGLRFAWN